MPHIFKQISSGSSLPSGRVSSGAYTVDEHDAVQPISGFPQSSVGAPLPVIVADEHSIYVAFYLEERNPNWDGKTAKLISHDSVGEPVAIVRFISPIAHFFGPPNDEAFGGHPLAARGLKPYGAFEVLSSSWIRTLERMNSIHPYHRPEAFSDRRHLILTFHDSIFECIAKDFVVEQRVGSLRSVLPSLINLL